MTEENKMKHEVKLIVGDWSGDGHGHRETFSIKSNLSLDDLKSAYKSGSEKIGINLIQEVCEKYEDNKFPLNIFMKIVEEIEKLGLAHEWSTDSSLFFDDELSFYEEEWVEIILDVCRIGNPKFEYENLYQNNHWPIGGYGICRS